MKEMVTLSQTELKRMLVLQRVLEPPETTVLIRHYFIILNFKKKCQRPGYTHLPALDRTRFTEVMQLCVFPRNDSPPVITSEDTGTWVKGTAKNPFTTRIPSYWGPPGTSSLARFMNLVNSFKKASSTSPVGPFLCLATIISAMPRFSVSGR
ncbi:MAG: hypothetical protein PWP72_1494 [Thermoanaerobacter sp.]|nr:hypothetical protein [Thermoanaerobacter sp.]